ncbi:hypothetical protein D3C80_1252150 [compost metagenome]
MVVVMPAARPVVMVVIRHFFTRGLFLRQQGRFKSELAQRVLDFFDRGFVLGQRKVQPFAGNRDLDVANAGQAGKRGFDLRGAAAAIHAADRKSQRIVLFSGRFGLVMVVTAAGGMVVMIGLDLCLGSLFARQQSGFEAKLAQRVLDFFDRGFLFRHGEIQPFAGNRHLDVANAGQAGKRGFNLRRAAAAIHPTDREGQFLRFPVQTAACRNIHGFAPEFQSTVNLAPLATRASRGKMQFFDFF